MENEKTKHNMQDATFLAHIQSLKTLLQRGPDGVLAILPSAFFARANRIFSLLNSWPDKQLTNKP